MVSIVRYTPSLSDSWNAFVNSSKNGTFLFNREYMDYHKDRFQDHSLLIYYKEKLAALFVANETGDTLMSHGGLTYGGMVVSEDTRLEDMLRFFYHVFKHYHSAGIREVIYKCKPDYLSRNFSQEDLYALFRMEAKIIRRDAGSVAKIRQPITYQERRKRSIKKAVSQGLTISLQETPDQFWTSVLEPNLRERYNLKPVHSLGEMKLLMSRFPENIRFFGVGKEELLAGTIIFQMNHVVHAQYIAATPQGKEYGALDLLFSHLLEKIYSDKQYFSFGVSTEKEGQFLNRGLQEWKEGFSARTVAFDFYSVDPSRFILLEEYA